MPKPEQGLPTSPLVTKPSFIRKGEGEVPTMRSPVKFEVKLYVTTINSFHPVFIFCHIQLHLRYHIGLDLNIVMSIKNPKAIGRGSL